MIIVQVPKETLAKMRRRIRLHGSKRAFAKAAKVHENTITNVLLRGTAEAAVLEKIGNALEAQAA